MSQGPYENPPLPETVWKPLTRTFEKLARGIPVVARKDLLEKHFPSSQVQVRVAIIDAAAEEQADPRRPPVHARSVQRIVESLYCDGIGSPQCPKLVAVHPLDVQSRRAGEPTGAGGIDSLSVDSLVSAISNVLEHEQGGHDRLIINVSVGLDPIKIALNRVNLEPLIQVLTRASCLGALVIAPAGNLTGTDGPMIPAAFETMPAASETACKAFGIPSRASKAEYAPLVYAVGGLDPLDRRVAPNRRWGQPRLAALAASVSTAGPTAGSYSYPLSGTSAAAAIVAGVASATWAARPELDAHEVMGHLYEGGVDLDDPRRSNRAQTEFCLGRPFGPCSYNVHRVFLCGALDSTLMADQMKVPRSKRKSVLGCDNLPSTSYDGPHWPQSDQPPTAKLELCDVSGCRQRTGPVSAQLPPGAVDQGAYISGCPGCRFENNLSRLSGTLNWWFSNASISLASITATSYSSRTFGPVGSDLLMDNLPSTPTAAWSMTYSPPTDLLWVTLTVNFWYTDPNGQMSLQTDYQTILP